MKLNHTSVKSTVSKCLFWRRKPSQFLNASPCLLQFSHIKAAEVHPSPCIAYVDSHLIFEEQENNRYKVFIGLFLANI